MAKLFHLVGSPRPDSESLAGARVFLDNFRKARPDWEVDEMSVWSDELPEFDGEILQAKYARIAGRAFTDSQRDAFAVAERLAVRFALAERLLISTPMWNFGIPYKLKQWFDVISQPGLVFGFDPEHGYTGLLTGKRATVIYTSAVYGPGRGPAFGSDFQAPYLEDWLRWAGVDDIRTIHFRPNLATTDADEGRRQAHARARDLAKQF